MVDARVLEHIADHVDEHGYAIGIRELGAAMGWKSPGTVHSHLDGLRRLGLVDWKDRDHRTLHLTSEGRAVLARRAAA